MPEENVKNIRVSVKGEEGKHTNHKIRTIVISAKESIKALYCIQDKKIITYIFAKNKKWTMDKAKKWVADHTKKTKKLTENYVDQNDEFISITANKALDDGEETIEVYVPNSDSFTLAEDIEEITMGYDEEDVAEKTDNEESNNKVSVELLKIDKHKQLVYGVFLWPEEADHDGDVISAEDIEKVAHRFVADYRAIDEMHKDIISAEIVESAVAWEDDMNYYGKKLKKGAWFGAIKIHDKDVWEKVLTGEYKAFSVRIAGVREPIEEEGKE